MGPQREYTQTTRAAIPDNPQQNLQTAVVLSSRSGVLGQLTKIPNRVQHARPSELLVNRRVAPTWHVYVLFDSSGDRGYSAYLGAEARNILSGVSGRWISQT